LHREAVFQAETDSTVYGALKLLQELCSLTDRPEGWQPGEKWWKTVERRIRYHLKMLNPLWEDSVAL